MRTSRLANAPWVFPALVQSSFVFFGIWMIQQPSEMYGALSQLGLAHWLERFGLQNETDVPVLGGLLLAMTTFGSIWFGQNLSRQAKALELTAAYWVQGVKEDAGPQIATLLRSGSGATELDEFQDIILRAGARRWGGKGDARDICLGFYQYSPRNQELRLLRSYPINRHLPTTVAQYVLLPRYTYRAMLLPFQMEKRRLGLRKSAFQVPVTSPLERNAELTAVVIADSSKMWAFRGSASGLGARLMADWLAVGQLIATRHGEEGHDRLSQ